VVLSAEEFAAKNLNKDMLSSFTRARASHSPSPLRLPIFGVALLRIWKIDWRGGRGCVYQKAGG
jgi:hypothetical protein